jgi:hypothetical protein
MERTIISSVFSMATLACSVCSMLCGPMDAHAQDRWRAELRPALQIPAHLVNGEALGPGPGLELNVTHLFSQGWGIQAGLGHGQFDRPGNNSGYFEENAAFFGIRFFQPLIGRAEAILGCGTVYHNLAMEERNGERMAVSDNGFGWQVEGGIAMIFEQHWSLTPSLRYRSISRNFDRGDANERVDLDYLSASLAFAIHF